MLSTIGGSELWGAYSALHAPKLDFKGGKGHGKGVEEREGREGEGRGWEKDRVIPFMVGWVAQW